MFRYVPILLLIAAPVFAQTPTPTPELMLLAQQYNVVFGRPGPTPTPTTSPTPTATPTTPSGPVILCQMDFEASGCEDTGGDTCAANSGYEADYDTTTPLSGSYSGYTQGDDNFTNMQLNAAGGVCTDKAKVTVDFKFAVFTGSDVQYREIIGLQEPGAQWVGDVALKHDNRNIRFGCGDGAERTESSNIGLTSGATYNIRINWESDGSNTDCYWYVDTHASGDWGTGGVASGTLGSTDINDTVGGLVHHETSDGVASIIDDIGICDATSGYVTEGVKCGD